MANVKRSNLSDLAKKLKMVPPILPWESIKVGDILHRPPFWQLGRKDIKVTDINGEEMRYKILNNGVPSDKDDKMARNSVFARFITKRKILIL